MGGEREYRAIMHEEIRRSKGLKFPQHYGDLKKRSAKLPANKKRSSVNLNATFSQDCPVLPPE